MNYMNNVVNVFKYSERRVSDYIRGKVISLLILAIK